MSNLEVYSITTQQAKIATALSSGRQLLLLGQKALTPSIEGSNNAVYELAHLDWRKSEKELSHRISDFKATSDAENIPEKILKVLNWPWSIIFTSSIDDTLPSLFTSSHLRLVNTVTDAGFIYRDLPSSLQIVRLFGTISQIAPIEAPPLNPRQLRARRTSATKQLSSIPSIASANGTLFIDGWEPPADWLRPRELAPSLATLAINQVFILGATAAHLEILQDDDDWRELLEENVVTLLHESLPECFDILTQNDAIPLRRDYLTSTTKLSYPVLKERTPSFKEPPVLEEIFFDRIDWLNLMEDFIELRELHQEDKLETGDEESYQKFREFISNGPSKDNIKHIQSVAYERPLVQNICDKCLQIAETDTPQDHTLLISGSSGCGKTVALGLVASHLRSMGYGVLYGMANFSPINRHKIEEFYSVIAEKSDAPIFLIYDGAQSPEDYYSLALHFSSRSQKCVVIGACYSFQLESKKSKLNNVQTGITEHYFSLPNELSESEEPNFIRHLQKFIPPMAVNLSQFVRSCGSNVFAIIYRSLPYVRGPLEEGFLAECEKGIQHLENNLPKLLEEDNIEKKQISILGEALSEALGIKLQDLIEKHSSISDRTALTSGRIKNLIDLVMLTSYYNIKLPQTIALRLLSNDITAYRGAFTGELLKEELIAGDYLLSARHALEAEIWLFKTIKYDNRWNIINAIQNILDGAQLSFDDSIDTEFLLSLFKAIGPQGPEKWKDKPNFSSIANFISNLRDKYTEISPRLQLVESHCARESVSYEIQSNSSNKTASHYLKILKNAEDGLHSAYTTIRDSSLAKSAQLPPSTKRLLGTFETERACILGTKIGTILRLTTEPNRSQIEQAFTWWKTSRDAWRNSIKLNEQNPRTLDSACWICEHITELGVQSKEQMIEVLAEWHDIIDRYELTELSIKNEVQRTDRISTFYTLIDDYELVQKNLDWLKNTNIPEAKILLLRYQYKSEGIDFALNKLREIDSTCGTPNIKLLFLYLRFWWIKHTQTERFFTEERLTFKNTLEDWNELYNICNRIRQIENDNTLALYFEAIASLHMKNGFEAKRLIRTLDRLNAGASRRSKSLVLFADAKGTPIKLSAMYKGYDKGKYSLAWCDQLGTDVEFLPIEFGYSELRSGDIIEPFHLAVTFRGLRAELTRRYQGKI